MLAGWSCAVRATFARDRLGARREMACRARCNGTAEEEKRRRGESEGEGEGEGLPEKAVAAPAVEEWFSGSEGKIGTAVLMRCGRARPRRCTRPIRRER